MKFKMKIINIFSKNSKTHEENENSESDFMEDSIGSVGTWQVAVATAATLTRFISMGNMTSIVFLTPVTNFICVELADNAIIIENETCYENCTKYVYSSDVMESSLTSDFGLICEDAWLRSFPQTFLMLGVLSGASVFGWISDRFGRRVSLLLSTALNIASMIPISFVSDFWTFNCLRFLVGVGSSGSLLCLSIVYEVIGTRHREIASAITALCDGLSEAVLALIAYFLPTWKNFLLGFSMPSLLLFILVCFIPESPRWLVSNGKYDKAIEILERAAKINNRSNDNIREIVMKYAQTLKLKENETKSINYLDFFKDKSLRYVTASTLCIWLIVGCGYYGIYQFVSLLSDNVFIIVPVLGLIQFPLCPINVMINKLLSRKASMISTLIITGCSMIILVFTPPGHWFTDLLGVISFTGGTFSFAILFLYEAELFPTRVRDKAYGLSCTVAKIGAMIAPFIANISPTWIASAVFGGISLFAALICITLPETKGKNLKDVSMSG